MVLGNNSKQDIRLNMHPFKNDINNSAIVMNYEMYMKYYGMIRFAVNNNTSQILNFMNEIIKR